MQPCMRQRSSNCVDTSASPILPAVVRDHLPESQPDDAQGRRHQSGHEGGPVSQQRGNEEPGAGEQDDDSNGDGLRKRNARPLATPVHLGRVTPVTGSSEASKAPHLPHLGIGDPGYHRTSPGAAP